MEKKTLSLIKKILLIFASAIFLVLSILFFAEFFIFSNFSSTSQKHDDENSLSYHIIVTGTYENQLFMQQVYEGASKYADYNCAVVELYVPQSQADDSSLQDLLDYCSYVNADGIIAYIDSPDENLSVLQRSEEVEIPLVTTGQFAAGVHQISFIGNSYWELGKKVADEIISILKDDGNAFVINEYLSSNVNINNLITSMQTSLRSHENVNTVVLEDIGPDFQMPESNNLFISLNEDSTIKTVQTLSDMYPDGNYKIIGLANNEACQLYLEKGLIYELIYLDPEKIGEMAITELFEFRNKGYANSYIAADVKISRTNVKK